MSTPEPHSPVPPARRSSSGKIIAMIVVLVVILVAGVIIYRAAKPAARTRPVRPMAVATSVVRQGDLHLYLTALGSVSAWNTVTVRSRADGQLLKLHFTEGQQVQEGDLLAEIDPRAYQVGLEQAEGQQARDQALLENARRDLARYQSAGESVTPQQTDTAKASVDQYQGIVRIDQGNVDNYKLQLSYCRVTAPSSGRTGIRLVDEGNLVHASDATGIVVITQDQPIAVLFSLPEDSLPQVRRALQDGNQSLAVDAYDRAQSSVLATGKVIALDNQIDATTGTVRLKAEFANADGALFPNQFVNVRLLAGVVPDSTLVAGAAVQINGTTRYVFVVKPDKTVEQRTVTVGQSEGDVLAVTSGLTAGDVVVTEGLDKLTSGAEVIARPQGVPGAAPAAAPPGKAKGGWNGQRREKPDAAKKTP